MTKEEYNKSRPGEVIAFENEKIVVRVLVKNDRLDVFTHTKSKDGNEQLPLAYILGFNALTHKY